MGCQPIEPWPSFFIHLLSVYFQWCSWTYGVLIKKEGKKMLTRLCLFSMAFANAKAFQAKNILPPHLLTHARIFDSFIYIYFCGHSRTSFLGLATHHTPRLRNSVIIGVLLFSLCGGLVRKAGRAPDLWEEASFWLDFLGYFFYQEKKWLGVIEGKAL